ncbi:MAG: prolyl aminopeptidase [Acidimicrobiales bacterium]
MHPITEPFAEGMLDVGDGHLIHWEVSGNPSGKPAVLLHGGPGGGSSPRHRRLFDPTSYRIVQFDQRNCGRSSPHAGEECVDLSANTTADLVADIERLRESLGIDRWLIWGGSWGTTLGLAYAQAHPESVSELVLASIVTTTAAEVDWVTRVMGRVFPEQWSAFVAALPETDRDGNLARAYNRLLLDPDPAVHEPAALAWCEWEDVHVSIADGFQPSLRYEDPAFRLCFARLVTHYWANAGFLEDGELLRNADRLASIPTFLAHGRRDISGPADIAVALAAAIPGAELFIAEEEGHGGPTMTDWVAQVLLARAAQDRHRHEG